MKLPDISSLKPIGKKAVTAIGQVVTNPNALTAGTVVGIFSTTFKRTWFEDIIK